MIQRYRPPGSPYRTPWTRPREPGPAPFPWAALAVALASVAVWPLALAVCLFGLACAPVAVALSGDREALRDVSDAFLFALALPFRVFAELTGSGEG